MGCFAHFVRFISSDFQYLKTKRHRGLEWAMQRNVLKGSRTICFFILAPTVMFVKQMRGLETLDSFGFFMASSPPGFLPAAAFPTRERFDLVGTMCDQG